MVIDSKLALGKYKILLHNIGLAVPGIFHLRVKLPAKAMLKLALVV